MTLWIFIVILFALALIDYSSFKIPNIIVLPAIACGIFLTGNWLAAIAMFIFGAAIYKQNIWRGGDVKLMALFGAFMGWPAVFILPITIGLIYTFRIIFRINEALPVTPFSFVAMLPFVVTIGIRC